MPHLPPFPAVEGTYLKNNGDDDGQNDKTSDTAHYCP